MEYKRIRELREDNDKTQQQISLILDITQQQYQLYESGKRTIPSDYLPKLAVFYNTSIDYLLRTNKSKNAISSCEYEHKKISPFHKGLILCNDIFCRTHSQNTILNYQNCQCISPLLQAISNF